MPLAGRHPGYGNVEAVQVVGEAELGCRELAGHQVDAAGGVDRHLGRQFDVAVHAERLGIAVVDDQLVVGKGVTL